MPLRTFGGAVPLGFRSTRYFEADESPEGSFHLDRGQVVRRVFVDWAARAQAEVDFAGRTDVVDALGLRWIKRLTPHQFPPKPWMYCLGVPSEKAAAMLGTDNADVFGNGVARYDLCEMSFIYAMPTYHVREDAAVVNPAGDYAGLPDEGYALEQGHRTLSRYVTKKRKHASTTLVLNQGLLRDSANKVIMEGIPFPQPGGEVQYTWHQIPEDGLPETLWVANANSVNDATFDGYPAGTLLFDGSVETNLNPNPITGQFLYDVTYRFKVKLLADQTTDPVTIRGWNYTYRKDGGLVPKVVSTDGTGTAAGTRMFRDLDFKRFFRPDPVTL